MSDMPDFSNVDSGSSSTAVKIHEVKSGDSLSKIAKQEYGDASKWPQIFEANKDILKDPNKIFPGQKLKIPAPGSASAKPAATTTRPSNAPARAPAAPAVEFAPLRLSTSPAPVEAAPAAPTAPAKK